MFNYANNNIRVAAILDNRRITKKGTYPVKIRVTCNRVRKYYPTGKDITREEWEKLVLGKGKKLLEIRTDIQNSFDKIKNIIRELESEDDFSFDALQTCLGKIKLETLNDAFRAKIAFLLNNEQIGSYIYYKDTLKSIEDFAGSKIAFTSITVHWLKNFERCLFTAGKSYTTIGMRCRAIRSVMNDARKAGTLKENQYPFGNGKFEIPTGQGRKLALNLQQIKKVITYSDGTVTTERYRDLWFFSYLCNGVNFADLLRLKFSNIRNGEICFMRSKTIRTSKVKKELQAVITPEMQAIMNKWGNEYRHPDAYIFGYLKGDETPLKTNTIIRDITRRCNRRLKLICEAIGIDGISTYTARHSYATVLKRSGANIAYISESLGHNNLKTTENYLASFEREERIKNANLLTNFDY